MSCFKPRQKLGYHAAIWSPCPSHSPTSVGQEGESEKGKNPFMFWDKNSLVIKIIMTTATIITIVMIRMITKRERGIKSKKKRTHAKCSLPTGQCLFYSMPKQWLVPPDSSPQLINWTWCSMVWNNTLASLDQALWSCFISAFCAAPHWQNTTHWKVLDFMPTLFSNS